MNITSMTRSACFTALASLAMFSAVPAQASISLSGTRMVLQEQNKEASIVVRNGESQVLVQTWLETNTADDSGDLPFAVTPPLAKVAAKGQQILRVMYAGSGSDLPRERETVMWLNVQELPQQQPGENQLQIAVRQRIKVFFRPQGLPGSSAEAPLALRWSAERTANGVQVTLRNPSAYHVSFSGLRDAADRELASPGMLEPGKTQQLQLSGVSSDATLQFTTISDFGSAVQYRVRLAGAEEVAATAVKPAS